MTKVSKAGQRETKETQRKGKSIKIALKSARVHPGFWQFYCQGETITRRSQAKKNVQCPSMND
jgi:hypothetical protein